MDESLGNLGLRASLLALLLATPGCFSAVSGETDSWMPPDRLGSDAAAGGGDAGIPNDAAQGSDGGAGTDAAEVPPGDIDCGNLTCLLPGEACQICDPLDVVSTATCEPGAMFPNCNEWGPMYPALLLQCDGPEDCPAGEACFLLEGSIGTYANCWSEADFATECGGGWSTRICRTLADCPACATGCEPYQPGYPVSVCQM